MDRRNPFQGAQEFVMPAPEPEAQKRQWTWVPPFISGDQVEGTSMLPFGRYRMPDGSEQVSFGLPQTLLDAWRGMQYATGGRQDPDAPQGYVSQEALQRGAEGITTGQLMTTPFLRAPMGALRTGAMGSDPAPYVRELDESGHFSQMVEALTKENKKRPKSGTAQQWRNYLQNQGVKKEEMRWTGMDKWLESQDPKAKISLEDIQTYANENRVNLQRGVNEGTSVDEDAWREQRYDELSDNYYTDVSKSWKETQAEYYRDDYLERYEVREGFDDNGDKTWRIYDIENDEYDDWAGNWDDEKAAQKALEERAIESADEYVQMMIDDGQAEWSVYDRDGDEVDWGYSSEDRASEALVYRIDDEMYQDGGPPGGAAASAGYLDDRPQSPFEEDYRETLFGVTPDALRRGGVDRDYTGSHFDTYDGWNNPLGQNVVGHTLSDVYYDAATNSRGRMVHEIQSDWQQQMRTNQQDRAAQELFGSRYKVLKEDQKAQVNSAVRSQPDRWPLEAIRPQAEIDQLKQAYDQARAEASAIERPLEVNGEFYGGLSPRDRERISQSASHLQWLRTRAISPESPESQVRHQNNIAQEEQILENLLRESGATPMPTETAQQLLRAHEAAQLRATEAEMAFNAAREGIPGGPFVTDSSGPWRQLIGGALYEAAQDGQDWFAFANPADRWGQHLNKFYKTTVPNTLKKLAQQHDPNAEIMPFYPTDQKDSRPPYTYSFGEDPTTKMATGDYYPSDQSGQMWLFNDNDFGEQLPRDSDLRRVTTRQGLGSEIEMVPFIPGTGTPMSPNASRQAMSEAEPRYRIPAPGDIQRFSAGGPVRSDPNAVGPGAFFRSRDAAENAMTELQRQMDAGERPPFDPSDWDEKSTHTGYGIRLTPEMRKSILEKGFPLFSQGAGSMPFVMSQWQASPEEPMREGEPMMWSLP